MKKSLYILSQFNDRDFDWLLIAGKRQVIPAGGVLIREGEPTDALYLVVEGVLVVSVGALDEEIAWLYPGEIAGEMSFVDARLPSATVKALHPSIVWAIPRFKLTGKLLSDVEFACHFYHAIAVFLSDRLRDTVRKLGQDKDMPSPADENNNDIKDLNPQVAGRLELAEARLNWLLNRLKETH